MAKIYRKTDRITVKIDDVTVKLAPLTLHEKTEVQTAMMESLKTRDLQQASKGLSLALKLTVKGIEGIEDSDSNPYKLQFDENNQLTDECVDDLLNLEITEKLTLVCTAMVKGIPSKFTNEKNEALEGVEVVKLAKEDSLKKD